jgi:hypothetical protein
MDGVVTHYPTDIESLLNSRRQAVPNERGDIGVYVVAGLSQIDHELLDDQTKQCSGTPGRNSEYLARFLEVSFTVLGKVRVRKGNGDLRWPNEASVPVPENAYAYNEDEEFLARGDVISSAAFAVARSRWQIWLGTKLTTDAGIFNLLTSCVSR